jgi:hypothetical protein
VSKIKLRLFLDDSNGQHRLYACRGARCTQDRLEKAKVQCSDCVLAKIDETLEQLMERLAGGQA